MSEIRVRFAPSPTGYLHVGGLRTALYNYLFARNLGGKNILRIEDTDQTRFNPDALADFMKSLSWAGIEFDESPFKDGGYGPYVQSERTDLYRQHAKILEEKGLAYKCFCTHEDLEKQRAEQDAAKKTKMYDRRCRYLSEDDIQARLARGDEYTIRLKVPLNQDAVEFEDLVYGKITVVSETIDDQVLLKKDGFPTYHLANVVDDHYMKISHVFRGEEWVPSTPKHIVMYKAFGWEPPKFAHLPLMVNSLRKKLSKRHDAVSVESFRDKGFMKDALVNFIALCGWHPSDDRELFTMDELIKEFSIERVSKSSAVFDYNKLNWMNGQYLKKLSTEELADLCNPFFAAAGLEVTDRERYLKVLDVCRGGLEFVEQIVEKTRIFFSTDFKAENAEAQEMLDNPVSKSVFAWLAEKAVTVENLTGTAFKELVNQAGKELSVKGKNLWMPVRVALTGQNHGPEMDQIVDLFGKDKVVERMQNASR